MRTRRVVVIGAGIGGLVAALRLAAEGFAVTLIESAEAPGGKMREVCVDGAKIDAGPTVLTMLWVFEEILAEVGVALRRLSERAARRDDRPPRLERRRTAGPVRRHRAQRRRDRRFRRQARGRRLSPILQARARHLPNAGGAVHPRRPAEPGRRSFDASGSAASATSCASRRSRRCGARSASISTTRACASCSDATRPIAAPRRSRRRRR